MEAKLQLKDMLCKVKIIIDTKEVYIEQARAGFIADIMDNRAAYSHNSTVDYEKILLLELKKELIGQEQKELEGLKEIYNKYKYILKHIENDLNEE